MTAFMLLLKRAGAWAMNNPLVTLILALLGAVGIQTARVAVERRRTAKAEAKATVATVEGQVAVIAEQRKQAEAERVEAAGELAHEAVRDDAAAKAADDALSAREQIADKWNRK